MGTLTFFLDRPTEVTDGKFWTRGKCCMNMHEGFLQDILHFPSVYISLSASTKTRGSTKHNESRKKILSSGYKIQILRLAFSLLVGRTQGSLERQSDNAGKEHERLFFFTQCAMLLW